MDEEGETKSAQAYQVISRLLLTPDHSVSDIEATRAMEYFSDVAAFKDHFLPWPRSEGPTLGNDVIHSLRDALAHAQGRAPENVLARVLAENCGSAEDDFNKQAAAILRRLRDKGFDIVLTA